MTRYLDHNATTAMLPEVLEAMAPWWHRPANPASVHGPGQRAAMAVDAARASVAALVGGRPEGVVFTSGATEANHLFLRAWPDARAVQVGALEHPCVLGACAALGTSGTVVRVWPAQADGRVAVDTVADDTDLVSVMVANHETGVIQPWEAALGEARRVGARFHTDATQAAGRLQLDLSPCDGVTLTSHKLGGPPGVGALVLGAGVTLPRPLLTGGAQQRGRRAGTVPTALVVGFGVACGLATRHLRARVAHLAPLTEALRAGLRRLGAREVGAGSPRLPNTTCVVFPGIEGESLVQSLDLAGFAVSSGAACASGSTQPSPVLEAMGDPEPRGALRVSLGHDNTRGDVEALLAALPRILDLHREV